MNAIRVMVLPSGRRVRLGDYCHAWRNLLARNPDATFCGWHWSREYRASEILVEISAGVHDRINIRGGLRIGGRDDSALIRCDRHTIESALFQRVRQSGRNILRSRYLARRYPLIHNPID